MIVRIVVCFLLFHTSIFSQTSGDSLKKIWLNEQLSDSIRFDAIHKQYTLNYSDFTENLKLTDYHFKLAQRKKSESQKITALHRKAVIQYSQGDLEAAKNTLEKESVLAQEKKKPLDLLNVLILKSGIALDERNFLEAIKSINSGSKLSKEHGLEKGEVTCLINSAGFYELIGNYDLSLEYLAEAERRSIEINYEDYRGLIWMNQGTTYQSKKDPQNAIKSSEKALEFFSKTNNAFQQASCYFTLASAYNALGKFDLASDYVDKSLSIDSTFDYELRTLEGLMLKADIILHSDVNRAKDIGLDVLKSINADYPHDIQQSAYELMFKCYKELNDYEKSLEYHEMYTASSDSMLIEETNFASVREAVKYEFELELYETQLKNEKEQTQLKINQVKKNYLIVSISVAIILLLIITFLVKSSKMRKKREELLKELEELKLSKTSNLVVDTKVFALNRDRIEESLERKLNETDWKVLQTMVDDPVITNKEIAKKVFLSEDGIGSSLRRMYDYFEVKETKYKKIALIMNAIKRSN